MAATALIQYSQGVTVGTPGQVLVGVVGTLVTIQNNDNTGVNSWQVDLVYTPPGSAVPVAVPLAFNNASSTPLASFTPDVPGPYRIELTVWDAAGRTGSHDSDIRNFIVPEPKHGLVAPPYQADPSPKPTLASGLPGAKPNEMNIGGSEFGWSGSGTDGLLTQLIRRLDAANFDALPDVPANIRPGNLLEVSGATGVVCTDLANHINADANGRVVIQGFGDLLISRVPNTGDGPAEIFRPFAFYTTSASAGKFIYFDSASSGQRQWQVGQDQATGQGFLREIVSDNPPVGLAEPVAGALLNDGETFTIGDGVNPPITFEFDNNSIVTPGNVPVPFTNLDTAFDVRDAIVTAVNGSTSLIEATPLSFGPYASLVNYANRSDSGNVQITWTVADPSFGFEGMDGGRVRATYTPFIPLVAATPVVAIDFDGVYLWASDGSGGIYKIDIGDYPWASPTVIWTWASATGPVRMRIDQNPANYGPPAKKGFFLDFLSGNVVRFDLGSPAAPEATAPALAPYGYGLAINSTAGVVYASSANTVSKINVDLSTGTGSMTTALWETGLDLMYDSATNKLYVVAVNAEGNYLLARMNSTTLVVESLTELSTTSRNLTMPNPGVNLFGLPRAHSINNGVWVADPQADDFNGTSAGFFDVVNAAVYRMATSGGAQKLTGVTGTWTDPLPARLNYTFTDLSADFVAANVQAGDILSVELPQAFGYILPISANFIVEGQTFTLNDGVNPPTIFEFDSDSIVTPGNIAVPYTLTDDEGAIAQSIITAVNGVGLGTLAITAFEPLFLGYNPWPFSQSDRIVTLVNVTPGSAGNVAITSTVTSQYWVTYGMLGATKRFVYTISSVLSTTSLEVSRPIYGTGTAQAYSIFSPIPKNKVALPTPKGVRYTNSDWTEFETNFQNGALDASLGGDGFLQGKYQKLGNWLKVVISFYRGVNTNFGSSTQFIIPYPEGFLMDIERTPRLFRREFPYTNLRLVHGLATASPTLIPTPIYLQVIPPGALIVSPAGFDLSTLLPNPGDFVVIEYAFPILTT